MSKKPADQASNQPNGSGDAVDLNMDLDGDTNDSGAADGDADEDEDGTGGSGNGDLSTQITAAVEAAMVIAQRRFEAETDRRVNKALAKVQGKGKPAAKDSDEDEDEDSGSGRQARPAADVRGARIAFREYLPDEIKLFSTEERQLATDFGQNLIRSKALEGFDDEDQMGLEAAKQTAAFLTRARNLYSSRTKRVLEKQGALVPQGGGQSPSGGQAGQTAGNAFELALKKDRELFPERYANQQQ